MAIKYAGLRGEQVRGLGRTAALADDGADVSLRRSFDGTKVGTHPPSILRIFEFEMEAKDLLLSVAGAASRPHRGLECGHRLRWHASLRRRNFRG